MPTEDHTGLEPYKYHTGTHGEQYATISSMITVLVYSVVWLVLLLECTRETLTDRIWFLQATVCWIMLFVMEMRGTLMNANTVNGVWAIAIVFIMLGFGVQIKVRTLQ